jgi:hypothetical protein
VNSLVAEEYQNALRSLRHLAAEQGRVLDQLERERSLAELRYTMARAAWLAQALGEEQDEFIGESGTS